MLPEVRSYHGSTLGCCESHSPQITPLRRSSRSLPLVHCVGDKPGKSTQFFCNINLLSNLVGQVLVYKFFEHTDLTRELARGLDSFKVEAGDGWSFKSASRRDSYHGLIQYPAMMVPSMQKRLLNSIDRVEPGCKTLLDPFMGSGTMLTEALASGHRFIGRDINPLAVLACQTKATRYKNEYLKNRAEILISKIEKDRGRSFEVRFPNYRKWFSVHAMIKLSRVRRAIMEEIDPDTRKLFWLVLAETVRVCSNSRTTTYKLHIRPSSELDHDARDAADIFKSKLRLAIDAASFGDDVGENHTATVGLKNDLPYRDPAADVAWGDSADPSSFNAINGADLIFTSPPYGDNVTTVTYGQFSYLPLQWIPTEEISPNLPDYLFANTCAIDSSSLGGSKRRAKERAENLMARSSSFKDIYTKLSNLEGDYAKRVSAFSYDLVKCFDISGNLLANNGMMFVTVGNRSVGGETVPLDGIISDCLAEKDIRLLGEIERNIPRKRMPNRNSISKTMNKEKVLIFQKMV